MAPQNTVNQANECFDTAPTVEIPEDQPIATPQSPSNHTVLDFPATATERAKIHQENFEVQTSQSPPEQLKRSTRITILALVITCLFVGRFSVPSNEPPCVVDHILNAFESANKFINTPGNEIYRSTFQFICSLFVDITFVITFGYWALKARTVRLPLSMALFYIVRALIQKVWLSPFPEGYWWYSPGIPSFVVPYGRGSDFFFSGHTGFLILCACEWNKLGFKKVRNFVYGVAAYTILILFIYRIHYTIDIFTAIIFADWCFGKIDNAKERIENTTVFIIMNIKQFINRITQKQSTPEEKFVAA